MLKQHPTRQKLLTRLASAQWLFLAGNTQTLEIRVIGKGGTFIKYCNNEREFIDAVLEAHTTGAVYVGVQPRRHASTKWLKGSPGGKAEDVFALRTLFVDFDPPRAKDTAATEEQRLATQTVAEFVVAELLRRGLPKLILIDSGNGVHLYGAVPEIVITSQNRAEVAAIAKAFETFVRDLMPTDCGVRCDAVADLPRITRVWGSLNLKGAASPEEARQVVPISENLARVESAVLWDFAASLPRVVASASKSSRRPSTSYVPAQDEPEMPQELTDMIEVNPVLHQLFCGVVGNSGDTSQSGTDAKLALALAMRDFTEREIRLALFFRPGGTAAQKRPGYLERTVAWALDTAAECLKKNIPEDKISIIDDLNILSVRAIGSSQRLICLNLEGGGEVQMTVKELLDRRQATARIAEALCRLPFLPTAGGAWQKFVNALLQKAERIETSPEASERGMRLELVRDAIQGLPESREKTAIDHGCAVIIDNKKVFRLAAVHKVLQVARVEIAPVNLGALLRELGSTPIKFRINGRHEVRAWEIAFEPRNEVQQEYTWTEQ
jgi:hypothetical protein